MEIAIGKRESEELPTGSARQWLDAFLEFGKHQEVRLRIVATTLPMRIARDSARWRSEQTPGEFKTNNRRPKGKSAGQVYEVSEGEAGRFGESLYRRTMGRLLQDHRRATATDYCSRPA